MYSTQKAKPSWLEGVIYQIYLRSFQDSNGDGVGDLRGVIQRLEYLRWLGVSGIWLTPFYPSPLFDSGYDAADFAAVHPLFGTMEDFDELIATAHASNLKVIIDFIPNHTSHEHSWFKQSRASRDNTYRDWYIWHDAGPGGGPPNNWLSEYGESAWTWDETTRQYYLHSFLAEQPDLNWRHAQLRDAIWQALRFWLDRGVDGVRIDALAWVIKDEFLRNHPPNPYYQDWMTPRDQVFPVFAQDQPEVEHVIHEMRMLFDQYSERTMLGEIRLPVERHPWYYRAGLDFPFNYQLTGHDWNALLMRQIIDRYEGLLGREHWPNWLLGTHDESRVATRLGPLRARAAAMLALTLRGTAVLYYGEEIGMQDVPVSPERVQDSYGLKLARYGQGRDPQRSPMQWSSASHAGFTQGEPWLPIADDYATCNVAALRDQPDSILMLYRRLLALRTRPALRAGRYMPDVVNADGFAFLRETEDERMMIALNFAERNIELASALAHGQIVLSTALDREQERIQSRIALRPYEGVVIELGA